MNNYVVRHPFVSAAQLRGVEFTVEGRRLIWQSPVPDWVQRDTECGIIQSRLDGASFSTNVHESPEQQRMKVGDYLVRTPLGLQAYSSDDFRKRFERMAPERDERPPAPKPARIPAEALPPPPPLVKYDRVVRKYPADLPPHRYGPDHYMTLRSKAAREAVPEWMWACDAAAAAMSCGVMDVAGHSLVRRVVEARAIAVELLWTTTPDTEDSKPGRKYMRLLDNLWEREKGWAKRQLWRAMDITALNVARIRFQRRWGWAPENQTDEDNTVATNDPRDDGDHKHDLYREEEIIPATHVGSPPRAPGAGELPPTRREPCPSPPGASQASRSQRSGSAPRD